MAGGTSFRLKPALRLGSEHDRWLKGILEPVEVVVEARKKLKHGGTYR